MAQSGSFHFYITFMKTGVGSSGVAVLDPATGQIRASRALFTPEGTAAQPDGTGTKLYTLVAGGAKIDENPRVHVIDTRTLAVDALIEGDSEDDWAQAVVVDEGRRLFLVQPNNVVEVDTASRERTDHEVPDDPVFGSWQSIAVSPDRQRIYLGKAGQSSTREKTPCVLVMNAVGQGRAQAVDIAAPVAKFSAVELLLSPDRSTVYAYVPNLVDSLVAINANTLTITARSQGSGPAALALSPNGDRLYAVYADRGGSVLDTSDLTVISTFPSAPDEAPAIAVAPDGTVCVAYSNHTCTTIDPDTGQGSAPARLRGAPLAVVVAAPTEVEPQPQLEYVAQYRHDAKLYTHEADYDQVRGTHAVCTKNTFVPAYDKVHEGQYRLIGGMWDPAGSSDSRRKKFYRIPAWDNVLVDDEDISWL